MICISIHQESRRMALADMLNASKQCDLLEIRLDKFEMAPDLKELLSHKPCPVIMSCRRKKDGGNWEGSEEERRALLRQCIVSKADYVEIEVDVADEIKPFPPAKRVISCLLSPGVSTKELASQYILAQNKYPDVIKLTAEVRTPEEAWPLVQVLARSKIPTVVVGLGKPGIMLALLGKKVGAPWTYAALEKGMEAYPGQPSVAELRDIYHYPEIDRKTRLIGVTGFGPSSYATVAGLNAAMVHLGLGARCLPLSVGSLDLFRNLVEAVKLAGLVIDPAHREMLIDLPASHHPSARIAREVDLILERANEWQGFFTFPQATIELLAEKLREKLAVEDPLKGRQVLIVGVNSLARLLSMELMNAGASVILAGRRKKELQESAQALNCRQVQVEAMYNIHHDVLILCDEEKTATARGESAGIHPGIFREGSIFLDLTTSLETTPLLQKARERLSLVLTPLDVLIRQIALQGRMFTGKQIAGELIHEAMPEFLFEM